MEPFGHGRPTAAIFLFFFIVIPLGIVSVVDRPNWDEAQWKIELENDREKHQRGGDVRPIPELIECALNAPNKFPLCDDDIQTALVNEILLRKQFKDFNEDCNSTGTEEGDLILNPPTREDRPDYPSYFIWQEKLINSKLRFCDPHKYLRCSTENKCVCLLGSIQVGNACVYSHGSPCTVLSTSSKDPNGLQQQYFYPFSTTGGSYYFRRTFTPDCEKNHETCFQTYRKLYYYRDPFYCVDTFNTFEEGKPKFKVFDYLEKLLPITFNEKCNSTDHNRLFTSTKEEDENFDVRFKTLEDFQIRGAKFCDLEKFLTCGPSEKCECMSPTSRKDGKCVLPEQLDKCEIDPTMEPILMNKSLVPNAREKLLVAFANSVACEGNLTCHSNMMEMYCTCPPGKTGQECNETLTKFLPIVRIPSLPTDVAGYPEKIKFFSNFNKVAVEFEKVFRRAQGSFCVAQIQIEAEILVGGIQKLKYRGTTMTEREYNDLSKRIQNFRIPHKERIICNETLRCQYSSKSCVNLTRRDYLQDLVQTLEKFKTRKCAQPDCSKFPKDFDDVMFGGNETQFYGGDHEMAYFRIIEELSKLLKKCDCRQKRVENMSPGQSLNHFILLTSVVTFFLATNC